MKNCSHNSLLRSLLCLLTITISTGLAAGLPEQPRLLYTFIEAANEVYDEVHGRPLFFGVSEEYYDAHDPWLLPQRGLYFQNHSYATLSDVTLTRDHTIDLLMLAFPTSAAATVLSKASVSGTFLHAAVVPQSDETFSFNVEYSVPDVGNFSISSPEISYFSWTRIHWALDYQPIVGTSLTLHINHTQVAATSLGAARIYDWESNSLVLGSATKSFEGYMFSLAIYDAAVVQVSTDLECECTHCYIEYQCLVQCLPHEFADAEGHCHPCDPKCRNGCHRAEDCRIHPDPLCFQFSSLQSSECDECVFGAEPRGGQCECLGNTELDVEGREGCVCASGYWLSVGECLPCIRWVRSEDIRAYFSVEYTELILDFSLQITTENVDCLEVFSKATTLQFGTQFTCFFLNDNQLIVRLGEEFTVSPGEISLNQGILKGVVGECNVLAKPVSVTLENRFGFPVPQIKVIAPQAVNYECEDLRIDACASSGRVKHQFTYSWTIEAVPANPVLVDNPEIAYDQPTLTIPRTYLQTGQITAALTLTNFLGQSSVKTFLVQAQPTGLVSLHFDRTINYSFYSSDLALYSVNAVSSCSEEAAFSINWQLDSATGNATEIDIGQLVDAQTHDKLLVIPQSLFSPFTTANFSVVATSSTGETGSVQFTVSTQPKPLVLKTSRSSGDAGLFQNLVISAADSYDPNEGRPLSFHWSCTHELSDCSDVIHDQSSPSLFVSAGVLSADTDYVFTITVSTEYSGQVLSASRLIDIHVVTPAVPNVLIATSIDKSQAEVVLAKDTLRLACFISTPGDYSYLWLVETGGDYILSSQPTKPTLSMHSLSAGFTYRLAVFVTDLYGTYRFTYTFYVNMPPANGDFEIRTDNTEFVDPATLQASNWEDPEGDYPLYYAFGFTFQRKKFYLNVKDQKSAFLTQLPFSNNLEFWVEVYDSRGDFAKKVINVDVARDEELDLNLLTDQFEAKMFADFTSWNELPGLMALLAVRVINEDFLVNRAFTAEPTNLPLKQRVFDLIIAGHVDLVDNMPLIKEEDIVSILSILELCTKNPALISLANTKSTVAVVSTLLNKAAEPLSFRSMNRLLTIVDNMVVADREVIYNNTEVIMTSLSLLFNLQRMYSRTMNFDELYADNTGDLAVTIFNSDLTSLRQVEVTGSDVVFTLPDNFSSLVAESLPSGNAVVGVTAIKGEQNAQFELVPDIIDLSFYDYSTLAHPSIHLGNNYISFNVPVDTASHNLTMESAECVFLDPALSLWETTGCEPIDVTEFEIVCRCNHLTTFSAGDALSAARQIPAHSNLHALAEPEKLAEVTAANAVGLYFGGILLVLYIVSFLLALSHDCKTAKSQEKQHQLDDDACCTDRSEVSEAPARPKSVKRLVIENHDVLRVFAKLDQQSRKATVVTIVFLTVLGEVFFVGLFYDQVETDPEHLLEVSFVEAVRQYSWVDFWAMLISAGVMLSMIAIFKRVFHTNRPIQRKPRLLAGLALAWGLMAVYLYGIVMFSLRLSERNSFLWMFNSVLGVFCDVFVLEFAKIFLVSYCVYCYSKLKFKIQSKEHRERNQESASLSASREDYIPV